MPAKLKQWKLSVGMASMPPNNVGKLARKALRLSLREGIRRRSGTGKHVVNHMLNESAF